MLDQGLINIFTAIVVGYAIFIVALGLAVARARDSVQLRVDHYATRVRMLEDIELERPLGERVFQPLLRSLARLLLRLTPRTNLKDVQLKLYRAGSPYNWTPVDFLGVRVALGLLFLLPAALLFLTKTFPWMNGSPEFNGRSGSVARSESGLRLIGTSRLSVKTLLVTETRAPSPAASPPMLST